MIKLFICIVVIIIMFTACTRSGGYTETTDESTDSVVQMVDHLDEDVEISAFFGQIPSHNEYHIILEMDTETRMVNGISRITFTNRTHDYINRVVLRVYQNAFNENVLPRPYFSESEGRVFRRGHEISYMDIHYVSVDNVTAKHFVNDTVLTVMLDEPLPRDATIQLMLQFSSEVPLLAHRTGGNDAGMWFGMFLPILSVYDELGWLKHAYYPAGNPFVLETANFHVAITTPIRYVVIGTGFPTEEIIVDTDTKTTHFHAQMVRDFAFAISPFYHQKQARTESGMDVYLYYFTESINAEAVMDMAIRAIDHFSNTVGSLPFHNITIAETELASDSYAFSQIIFANTQHLLQGNLQSMVQSIGEQWFANVVGSNRVKEPWLSDGLIRFIQASLFYPTQEALENRIRSELDFLANFTDLIMANDLSYFNTNMEYIAVQSRRAMVMLYFLEEKMGTESFWSLIRNYYTTFSFEIASVPDFIMLAQEEYGDYLDAFFRFWLNTANLPRLN